MNSKRLVKRIIGGIVYSVLLLILTGFIWFTGSSWWKRWVTYPRLEKERAKLLDTYRPPMGFIPLQHYMGAMHSHTWWSHDSRGVLEEIIPAAKKAELEFIFLSDHAHGKLDTFPRGYNGFYDGLLLVPGTETSSGLMVNPLDSVVLDWNMDQGEIIQRIVSNGGFVGYVHTEKEHNWGDPSYQAMEIYNIHTDLLDEDGILPFVINNLINGSRYRKWAYRELYDDQTAIHTRWDSLNQHRRIVGFSAVDAHNNQSFRARHTSSGQVEWVGPNAKTLSIKDPGILEKILLHSPDEAGWAYKWEMDTYYHSFNFVSNHVFCDSLTALSLKDHIVRGHVFMSFESLAPAKGFEYFSTDANEGVSAIMGDSVQREAVYQLKAISPFPVKYQLIKNGKVIDERDDVYDYEYTLDSKPGVYRVVASLKFADEWLPWVYTNHITIY